MGEEVLHQITLSLIPGIGPVTIKQLISYCGSATEVMNKNFASLQRIPGIGKKTAAAIASAPPLNEAAHQMELAQKYNASIISFTDISYPQRLKQLDDAPILLYTKGNKAFNNPRTLGIVGTRRASDYGRRAIRRLLGQLKYFKPTIISGLAYGIDITAHREALRLNLPTLAVLGSSLDKIYPDTHKQTAEKMLFQGGLVTELKFGTKPEAYHFPSRNRIIAGLSDALIVIEARKQGGALITVEYMRNYRKLCFAVPGPIDSPYSIGCNRLLSNQQALFAVDGREIGRRLGWSECNTVETPGDDAPEALVLSVLKTNPDGLQIDELCRKSLIPINKMGSLLLNLELLGLIKVLPGKKFMLVGQ